MKKKLLVSLMVLLMVFAVCGSAFAEPKWERNNNSHQQDYQNSHENDYENSYENSYQSNPYGMNLGQTYTVSQQFFFDVPQNHWAYKMIKEMKNRDIIKGDSDGNFYPERQVTRAEFATMLVRALNLPTNQGAAQTFVDVPPSFWGYNYIEAAQNYLTGYQNSAGQLYFAPQDSAVREDIIVALVRAEGLGNEQPDLSVLSNFVDANDISANLKGYVAIAVRHGLVQGSTDQNGRFHLYPQSKLTRAEAAAFLNRIIQGGTGGQQTGSQQDTKVIVGQQSGSQNQQGPVLSSATVNGATLTLTYNENLDSNSVPYVGDFIVRVNGIAQAAPTGITVSGNSVTLALYQAVPYGSTVTVSYTPGVRPLRDLTGYNTAALVNYQVSNGNTTSDTTPPAWLQGSALSISNLSGSGLTLTWPQATDNVGVTAYRIYENGSLLNTVNGSTLTYNVTGLNTGTQYTFQVQAGDAAGNWSTSVSTSVTTTALTDTQTPVWPSGSNLTASSVTQNSLTLTWPQATDNAGVTAYRIYENGSLLTTVNSSTLTYNVSGLTAGTQYTFQVQAGDAAGNWSTSVSTSVTTTALTDTQVPVWPSGSALTASSVTQNTLILTWSQATDNTGVTAYRIYQDGSLLATVSGSINSYTAVGLTANTAHTFRVDAGDAAGNWATGPSLNATTI